MATHRDPPPCIRHLRDYIAIPSVNPMRRTDIPAEIVGEARYAEHLHAQLQKLGLDVKRIGPQDRPSVVHDGKEGAGSCSQQEQDGQQGLEAPHRQGTPRRREVGNRDTRHGPGSPGTRSERSASGSVSAGARRRR